MSDCLARTPKILEFSGTINRRAVKDYMIVRVRPVYMSSHHESVAAFRKTERELPPDFVGFFRRDFIWFEALPYVVSEDVGIAVVAPGDVFIFFLREQELVVSHLAVTGIRRDKSAAIGFIRILDVIYDSGDTVFRGFRRPYFYGFEPSRRQC